MRTADEAGGANYATSFDERLFCGKCKIQVIVDLTTHVPRSSFSMVGLLSSSPTFSMSLESLRAFARAVSVLKANAVLLSRLPDEAIDHQLNCAVGGATAIVVAPAGKPGRFTMTIGGFHREGLLEDLAMGEIEEAMVRIESLQQRVVEKVVGKASKSQ